MRKDEPFARMGKIIDATTPCLRFPARQSVIRAMRQRVQTAIEVLAGLDELNAQWEKKAIALLKMGLAFSREVVARIAEFVGKRSRRSR